ncbi:ribonuclease T2 family protein [Azospirillum sp.]|uniref:ribonuclease T2 family protein n=1 Tax=Azospirillum sp. TaxID=34012 RepID=UPI003D74D7D9
MRIADSALFLFLVAAVLTPGAASAQRKAEPGAFDYYVLSLSWSPAYCARESRAADTEQCTAGKRFGWVVHGLWPQFSDGGYPRSCAPGRTVPKAVVDDMIGTMPDVGLILHEWRTHGTCSGLPATDYFAKVRAATAKVKVPAALSAPKDGLSMPADQVEAQFVEANPGLKPDMIALVCQRRQVSEVRVCLDKDLTPRACGKGVADRCGRTAVLK